MNQVCVNDNLIVNQNISSVALRQVVEPEMINGTENVLNNDRQDTSDS